MRTRTPASASPFRPAALAAALAGALAAAALLGASCATPRDLVVGTVGAPEYSTLEEREAGLRQARIEPGSVDLDALSAALDGLATRPAMSAAYKARLEALRGECALLRGDRAGAARARDAVRALSGTEEGAWLLDAWLAAEGAAKAKALEAGLAAADRKGRLRCELGLLRSAEGRYREAAALLDEGLAELGEAWAPLYGPARDLAFSLREEAAPPKGGPVPGTAPGGQKLEDPLSASGMVSMLAADTGFLAFASADKAPLAVLGKLAEAGFFLDGTPNPGASLARKEIAYFLLKLSSSLEGDPGLLTRYRDKYAAKAKAGKEAKSPVPDVPVDAPWFDAVLTLVEREIMELPDGSRFDPEGRMKGFEFLAIVKKLKARYR